MSAPFQLHTPEEEVCFMRQVLGIEREEALLDRVIDNFNVLQARSAMLLSLVTLCLTISGFSGHRIAASGPVPAALLSVGLALVVVSAVLLMLGPMQLRWATRRRCGESLDELLAALIHLRNKRTRRYHIAVLILILGLSAYVGSVVLSILPGGGGV
jgi:hypothetical protein